MSDTAIQIQPVKSLDVAISAPPSKAHSLRYIFIAALADGASRLDHLLLGEDQQLLDQMLGRPGPIDSPALRAGRQAYERGDFAAALESW